MAHVRRKFVEAETGDPALRRIILRTVRHLFLLKRVTWKRSPEERLRIRRELEKPIIEYSDVEHQKAAVCRRAFAQVQIPAPCY